MKRKKQEMLMKPLMRIAVSVLVGIIAAVITYTQVFITADNFVGDAIYQHSKSPELNIVILGIDEKTISALGNYNDWQRDIYADTIDKICTDRGKPAVIAFDILFSGHKDEAADRRFEEALRKAGNAVTGMILDLRSNTEVRSVGFPTDEIKAASAQGITNTVSLNDDDYIRAMYTGFKIDNQWYDSFGLATYRKYAEQNSLTVRDYSSLDRNIYRLNYTVKHDRFQHISLIDILDGTMPNPDVNLDGSIVLIGAYAPGLMDSFNAPISHGTQMFGVEIHANIIEALHSDRLITDYSRTVFSAIIGLICCIILYLLIGLELPAGAVLTAGSIAVYLAACVISYSQNKYMSVLYFPLFMVVMYIGMVVLHYFRERIIKAKISNAFKMYVAPQIVEEVANEGKYELKLGGQTKDIAVLFVDIRGFTTMSENLAPETVVEILNEYFAIITEAIFKNNGTLDKFIGDAAMAVFNSPFDLDDYVCRAVKTGWDIAAGSEKLSEMLMKRYNKKVSYGIGVNCGEAVIGNIGSAFRMDYTAIGDTVNTASRLESNAKAGQILISEEVYRRIKDRIEVEEVGIIPLKGKSNGVFVYNVTGIKE